MKSKREKAKLQLVENELECPICANAQIATSWTPFTFDYGAGKSMAKLSVTVPVRRCEFCDFDYLDKEGERIKHNAICRHLGVITPDEIRSIRRGFNLTRAEFCKITGLGEASINRWENGISMQTHAYDRYLRLLSHADIMSRLKEIVKAQAQCPASGAPVPNRFRALKVNDALKKKQQGFQLRAVA